MAQFTICDVLRCEQEKKRRIKGTVLRTSYVQNSRSFGLKDENFSDVSHQAVLKTSEKQFYTRARLRKTTGIKVMREKR